MVFHQPISKKYYIVKLDHETPGIGVKINQKIFETLPPPSNYLDVSKNRGGPPKWMVKIMENPIKTLVNSLSQWTLKQKFELYFPY